MSCIPCHQADQGCSKTISRRAWHWAQTITCLVEEAGEPQSHSEYLPHRIFETGNNEDLDHNRILETIKQLQLLVDSIVGVYESHPDEFKDLEDKLDSILDEMGLLAMTKIALGL